MINTDCRQRNKKTVSARKSTKHRGAVNTSRKFEQKNRVKQLFMVLLIWIGVLGFGMLGFSNAKPLFEVNVQSVQIEGDFERVQKAQIGSALQPLVGDGFFTLQLEPIKHLLERQEWVYRAEVSRRWPSGISIAIEEQTPIAIWNSRALLNADGEAFSAGDVELNEFDLPRIAGDESQQGMMVQQFREFSDMLSSIEHEIVELSHSDALGLFARLDNGTEIRFGNDRLLDKMRQFLKLHADLVAQREGNLQTIDFRYRRGVAVRWANDHSQGIASQGKQQAEEQLLAGVSAFNG
ncbi:MAG: cell division protein FtsQ/DivIB [Pseudomonadales bacterium]